MSKEKFERELFVIENKHDDRLLNLPENYVTMHWDWRPIFSSEWECTTKKEFRTKKSITGDEYRILRYIPDGQS
jgi:hypothetical protein